MDTLHYTLVFIIACLVFWIAISSIAHTIVQSIYGLTEQVFHVQTQLRGIYDESVKRNHILQAIEDEDDDDDESWKFKRRN